MQTHQELITKIVAEQLGIHEADIKPDSHLANDLAADSLDMIEIIMGIEGGFEIEIADEDCEGITTVQQAAEVVKRYLGDPTSESATTR